MNARMRHIIDKISANQTYVAQELNRQMNMAHKENDSFRKNIQNEREALDVRLSKWEDPEVIINNVTKRLDYFRTQHIAKLQEDVEKLKESNEKIWNENLLIPDLICKELKETESFISDEENDRILELP